MTESSQPDGTRLRLARQARGLSQQQLAGVAGVTRQAVSAVESGHSDPSLRVALGLARALGVTVEELFGPGELGDSRHHLLRSTAPCAPCFRRTCPIDFRCMLEISVDAVVRAVLEIVQPQLEPRRLC